MMVENTLFILGSFFVAWLLGRVLNVVFELLFPAANTKDGGESKHQPVVSSVYRELEWLESK